MINSPTIHNPRAVSTETNDDYIIVFNDDSTRRISKDQAEAVMTASGGAARFITLEGMMIQFSNIARLIPTREYWNQFPDERPQTYPDWKNADTGVGRRQTVYDSKKTLRQALAIWKRQRSSPNYVRVTGGLDNLIKDGEERLRRMEEKGKKKLECNAGINLSDRESRLKAIREKRMKRGFSPIKF